MSDLPQGPEAVAYALMRDIAEAEAPALAAAGRTRDRDWILATFALCLRVVRSDIPKALPTHGRSSF